MHSSIVGRFVMSALLVVATTAGAAERQVTHDNRSNHVLDNNDNFSSDDRFLVFDTRSAEGAIAASSMIAKVEIATGEMTPLYRVDHPNRFGPGVGAASFAHDRDEVVFIHGPFHPTDPSNGYEQFRRIGVMAAGDGSGKVRFADARNPCPPFVAGALRGGTHRHEWSGDGRWLGFTYNDAVMREYGLQTGRDLDLRTIGVTRLGQPVRVPDNAQFPDHGDGFSVLVVVVTPAPKPGSDEISRAADDSWVGRHGYLAPDGHRQLARAFIGTARDARGRKLDELYIVDIPPDITRPGRRGPLAGTTRTWPMPPAGTRQRRLTHTATRHHPGCAGIVRCSHDGRWIAFRMRDGHGLWQIFLVSPRGGRPRQATFIDGGVDTGVRWHPSGNAVVCMAGGSVVVTVVKPGPLFGRHCVVSTRQPTPFGLVWSHDGKTIAFNRRVKSRAGQPSVVQIFVVDYPDHDADGIPDPLDTDTTEPGNK